MDMFSIKKDNLQPLYSLQIFWGSSEWMKKLKKLYLLFWTICMLLVVVGLYDSDMKVYQKIIYFSLTLIAYISVIYLFKNDKKK